MTLAAGTAAAPAVVFDFGAVLFQWKPLQLLQQVVPDLAPDEPAAQRLAAQLFESFTPASDWAQFDLGLVDEAALASRIARRIGAAEERVRRVIDAIPGHLQPQPETVALLRSLKAAGRAGVAVPERVADPGSPGGLGLALIRENPGPFPSGAAGLAPGATLRALHASSSPTLTAQVRSASVS